MAPIRDPPAVLRHKLINRDWRTGNAATGADDDFARELERKLDGLDSQPRASNLDDHRQVDTGAARDQQIAALTALAGRR